MASMLGTQYSQMNQSGNSTQRIPKWQQRAQKEVFNAAKDMFGAQGNSLKSLLPQLQSQLSSSNAKVQDLINQNSVGGAFSDVNPTELLGKIESFRNTPSQSSGLYEQIMGGKGNSYLDAMKDSLLKDAQRRRDLSTASLDARLAGGGMSGGARHGVAQALIDRDINDSLANQMTQVGYNTFENDLQNKLNIARQADSNSLARDQMFTNTANQLISGKDANMDAALEGQYRNIGNIFGLASLNNMPWTNLQNYSAAIGNPTVLTNSTSNGSSYSGK